MEPSISKKFRMVSSSIDGRQRELVLDQQASHNSFMFIIVCESVCLTLGASFESVPGVCSIMGYMLVMLDVQ